MWLTSQGNDPSYRPAVATTIDRHEFLLNNRQIACRMKITAAAEYQPVLRTALKNL
jgi:hypothetical protein